MSSTEAGSTVPFRLLTIFCIHVTFWPRSILKAEGAGNVIDKTVDDDVQIITAITTCSHNQNSYNDCGK